MAGVFVATLSFTVLTATSRSQRLEVRRTVAGSFRSAYDILVRPRHSRTDLERRSGLVRPNYLSGHFGGIAMRDWRRIKAMPGIAVAAPIANIGYVLATFTLPIDLTRFDTGHGRVVLRVDIRWVTDRGLSRIDDTPGFVYITDRPVEPLTGGGGSIAAAYLGESPFEVMPGGHRLRICTQEGVAFPAGSAFDPRYRMSLDCFSRRNGLAGEIRGWGPFRTGHVGLSLRWPIPFVLSAIDPAQESKLTGLRDAVIAGRYLGANDGVRDVRAGPQSARHLAVPVLVASRSPVDESADLRIERFTGPAADRVPREPLPDMLRHPLERYLVRLRHGQMVGRLKVTPSAAYGGLLRSLTRPLRLGDGPTVDTYWTVGPTRYRRSGTALIPQSTRSGSDDVWLPVAQIGEQRRVLVPAAARDTQFRSLRAHDGHFTAGDGIARPWPLPSLFSVGRFDPGRLRPFNPLSAVPLETYAAPDLLPGDDQAKRQLRGRSLLPNGNLGGYLSQPPLMLTTLKSLRAFGSQTYSAASDRAPISAIRIRVAGVGGPDPISRERIRLAAERIVKATGLDVDITTGSSLSPKTVELAPGRFGRPRLRLSEPWVSKNVSPKILAAVDRKSLILFALILIVCALFVGNASAAAVQVRRTELGVLSALGWPARALFAALVGELVAVGIAAGVAAALLSVPLAELIGLHLAATRALVAIPAAAALSVVSGCLPAVRAAGLTPMAAVRPPVLQARRAGRPRTIRQLALLSALRSPGRSVLAAGALAIGVCALTLLLAATFAFSHTLVGTLLGDVISIQIRGSDYAAVAITLVLAAGTVADVLFLNIRDRESELAALRAAGWDDRAVGALVIWEAVWVGLLGSVLGAGVGLLGAAQFSGAPSTRLVMVAAAAALGGTVVAAGAAGLPAFLLWRRPLVQALATE